MSVLRRGREEEAAAHYERAVQEDPDHLHNLEGYARFLWCGQTPHQQLRHSVRVDD